MKEKEVIISIGSSVKNNKITTKRLTIRQLFRKLSQYEVRDNKDGPYFIFASFKNNQRNATTIVEYYGAAVDLDNTPLTIREIKQVLKDCNIGVYCIYTTHSHKQPGKGRRFRLVVPYDKPLPPATHRKAFTYLMVKLGLGNVDTSAKALSLPTYLPACPAAYEQHQRFTSCLKGPLFTASDCELSPAEQWALEQQTEHTTDFDINEAVTAGARNDRITQVVGKFISAGLSLPMVYQSALAWNDQNCDPPLSEEECKQVIESTIKTHTRNHGDTQWGFDEVYRRINEHSDPVEGYDYLIKLVGSHKKNFSASQVERIIQLIKKKTKIQLATIRAEIQDAANEHENQLTDDDEKKLELTANNLKDHFKQWVYLTMDERVYNFKNGLSLKKDGFNNQFAHLLDKGAMLSVLTRFNCIKCVATKLYYPNEDIFFKKDGIDYVNEYRPTKIKPKKGDVYKMLQHFKNLFPVYKERKVILNYISFIVQNPGEKILWMPIIKGSKRIGKSLIESHIITPMLGARNVNLVDSKALGKEFNAWQTGAQLLCFHELKAGSTRKEKIEVTETLKSFLTDKRISVRKMRMDPFTVDNLANVLAFTNHDDAIMMTLDEERFFMVRTEMKRKRAVYYRTLIKWLDNHIPQMYYYFLNRNIRNFDAHRAPDSNYTQEVKEQSLTWPGSIIAKGLQDKNHFFNHPGVFSYQAIVEYIRSESVGSDALNIDALAKPTSSKGYILYNTLRDLGFRKWGHGHNQSGKVRVKGQRYTVWQSPTYVKDHTPEQIKDILANEKTVYDFDDIPK